MENKMGVEAIVSLFEKEYAPEDIGTVVEKFYDGLITSPADSRRIFEELEKVFGDGNTKLLSVRRSIVGETLARARKFGARGEVIKGLEHLYDSLENPDVIMPPKHLLPYKIEKSGSGAPIKSSWNVSGWVDLHPGVVEVGPPMTERRRRHRRREIEEEREKFLSKFTVPLGQIGLAMRPGGVVSHSQIPEVYIGGEGIWGGDEHFKVLLLKSVPIEVSSKVSIEVPAVSVSENDKAVCRSYLRLWLRDPLKFARQAIVGSSVEENMANLSHVQARLGEAVLEAWEDFLLSDTDGGELWISDRESLEQKGYHLFEKRLTVWGLSVVEFICSRFYPQNLYDTALEIGEVEYALMHNGENQNVVNAVFDKEEKQRWRIMHDKGALPGEWFLSAMTRERGGAEENNVVKRISGICARLGAPLCERFVIEWYNLSTPVERAFAKQMVLAALKRPRLVIGSWLDRNFEA